MFEFLYDVHDILLSLGDDRFCDRIDLAQAGRNVTISL